MSIPSAHNVLVGPQGDGEHEHDLPVTPISNDISIADLSSRHHISAAKERAIAEQMLHAMRTVLLARWAELGLANVSIPPAVRAHLAREAEQAASQLARSHNHRVSRFLAEYVARYQASHGNSTQGLTAAVYPAVQDYLSHQASFRPADTANWLTGRALSMADLYVARPGDTFIVDGDPPDAQSCALCTSHYHTTMTAAQAWAMLFPAHPNCSHYIRLVQ